jgi:hypothetical protein
MTTTTTTRAHVYPCERAAGEHLGRWIIQTYHAPTGMPYADEWCPHYMTRAAARNAARVEAREAARVEAREAALAAYGAAALALAAK